MYPLEHSIVDYLFALPGNGFGVRLIVTTLKNRTGYAYFLKIHINRIDEAIEPSRIW